MNSGRVSKRKTKIYNSLNKDLKTIEYLVVVN